MQKYVNLIEPDWVDASRRMINDDDGNDDKLNPPSNVLDYPACKALSKDPQSFPDWTDNEIPTGKVDDRLADPRNHHEAVFGLSNAKIKVVVSIFYKIF